MKLDNRINTLQRSLKWFKDEALNLSRIVETKTQRIKEISGEHTLIQNEITLLTQALKNSKKENRICKAALSKSQSMTMELVELIKHNQKKYFKNELLKDKIVEIEKFYQESTGLDLKQPEKLQSTVLHNKDGKSLSNLVSPIVKLGYEKPIDSQQIFHQTQLDLDE